MIDIDWVVVNTRTTSIATEFVYAQAALRHQLPAHVKWLFEDEAGTSCSIAEANPHALILKLEHTWLSLEQRCIERLGLALAQGFDVAEACDSRYPSPMASGYATLRGMERFVDGYELAFQPIPCESNSPPALVKLTRAGVLQNRTNRAYKIARVCGAFAHDASNYFGSQRADVLPLVPTSARKFLDVGGGEGNFLALIKAKRESETYLVEFDTAVANQAALSSRVDHVWSGDFLEFQTPFKFDCITFLDMLEHVEFPGRHLERAGTMLSPEGVVIVSIPNVGHWSVVADLLEGRWDYVADGIHCITHLRFFTEKSISDLFCAAGFEVLRTERVHVPAPQQWLGHWANTGGLKVDTASLETYAYLVVGRPTSGD